MQSGTVVAMSTDVTVQDVDSFKDGFERVRSDSDPTNW